jgi:dTDP-4-amino-4,6-dideoxygalactose transaminase
MLIPRVHAYYNTREILATIKYRGKGDIQTLEQSFAQYFKHKYGILFPYSRRAVIATFDILGIYNKEIIMPAYTCVDVSHAVVKSGNIPIFVDSAPGEFNCRWDDFAGKINASTGALIGTHLFGTVMKDTCSKESLEKLKNIPILHDRTLAIGTPFTENNNVLKGLCSYYGLSLSKQFCMVKGGIVITDDEKLYKELISYRNKNIEKGNYGFQVNRYLFFLSHYLLFNPLTYDGLNYLAKYVKTVEKQIKYYDPNKITLPDDVNIMPSDWQVRVGIVQLEKLNDMNKLRKIVYNRYVEGLKELKGIGFYRNKPEEQSSHFILFSEKRDEIVKVAQKEGVDIGLHFDYIIPDLPSYESYRTDEPFNNSRKLAATVCNLPFWPGLSKRNQDKIIKVIIKIDDSISKKGVN